MRSENVKRQENGHKKKNTLINLNVIWTVVNWVGRLCTFGSREEQVVRGVHAEDGFGVALGHVDTLEFGPAAAFRGRHGIDHAPVTQTHKRSEASGVSFY